MKQFLFVMRELTTRELKRKYARSSLGVIWSVLNPLLSMVVISMVFSTMFKRSIENFPVYYLTGNIIWGMFTGATNSAMTSLWDNKALLIKTKLPKQIFPLSRILTSLVNFGYSVIAYVLILAFYRIPVTIYWIVFPVIILFQLLFSIGVGYILAIIYTHMADIKYLYSILLTLWMYLSALFYPVEGLPEKVQWLVTMNPIYGYIASARSCILYQHWPSAFQWGQMFLWGIGIYVLGKFIFEKSKNKIMIQNL